MEEGHCYTVLLIWITSQRMVSDLHIEILDYTSIMTIVRVYMHSIHCTLMAQMATSVLNTHRTNSEFNIKDFNCFSSVRYYWINIKDFNCFDSVRYKD